MRVLLLIMLLIPIASNCHNEAPQPFVLDQGKPYVYIARRKA